jgi:hypothetical protein
MLRNSELIRISDFGLWFHAAFRRPPRDCHQGGHHLRSYQLVQAGRNPAEVERQIKHLPSNILADENPLG